MKERGIIMSAPMVKALLDGSKTRTRRILKKHPTNLAGPNYDGLWSDTIDPVVRYFACPYGVAGDRLFVKEKFAVNKDYNLLSPRLVFEAMGGDVRNCVAYSENKHDWQGRWRPSIHMPRWASRITLELTGVRVERLQDITPADCIAEGITYSKRDDDRRLTAPDGPYQKYARLWDSLHGKGAWKLNPWVWVLEFRDLSCNSAPKLP